MPVMTLIEFSLIYESWKLSLEVELCGRRVEYGVSGSTILVFSVFSRVRPAGKRPEVH
jgi:hypothetical protein